MHLLELQTQSHHTQWKSEDLYKPYLSYLLSRLEKEGINKVIEINKSVRLSVTRYIAGEPYFVPFLRSTKSGLPDCLGPLKSLVRSGEEEKLRYVLSILAVTKPAKLPISPDLDSITNPGKNPDLGEEWRSFIKEKIKSLGWSLSLRSNSKDLSFLTTKSGPNGQALVTSLLDLSVIPEHLAENLVKLAPDYMTNVLKLYPIAKKLAADIGAKIPEVIKLRKLSPIQDKEGKTRIIAIGDYFSQAILRPIHEQLMAILKGITQDMTRNQTGHGKEFGNCNQQYHSLDLKSATDRFPIQPQEEVLAALSGDPEGARVWREVMTGYPFDFQGRPITYSVGQPMGLYSSWATFALTHHLIVLYAAFLAGKPDFSDYILLGDDIVIRDDSVASEYQSVMEKLGVEISSAKTLVSKDTFEFAKKTYHKGMDISPIPGWSLVLSNTSTELAGSLSEIYKLYHVDPTPESVSEIIGIICGNSSSKAKALGSARRLVPLLVYFPFPSEKGGQVAGATKLQKFFSYLVPGIPCWSVTTLITLTSYLVAAQMASVVRPGLRKMIGKYDDALRNIRIYISSDCSDQDPSSLQVIPLFSVLKQQNLRVNGALEDLIYLGAGILSGPLIFENLILSDPFLLAQDRQHLKIARVKSQLVLEVRKEFKRISTNGLTPSDIDHIYSEWLMDNAIIAS